MATYAASDPAAATAITGPRLHAARRRPALVVAAACVLVATASLLLPSAPSYDPWAWLVWGREVLHGDLRTATGPSWKPLTVLLAMPLSLLGGAAPAAWLVVSRAAALGAVAAAAALGARPPRPARAGPAGGLPLPPPRGWAARFLRVSPGALR